MATTIYRQQIKAFWRQMGESQGAITEASPDTAGTPSTIKRWTLDDVYDLFWEAGTALQEMMIRMGFEAFLKWVPIEVWEDEITLTTGVSAALANDYVFLYDNASTFATPNYYTCKRIPPDLLHIIPHATGTRWASDPNQSWFDIKRDGVDTKVYVYPTTMTKIYLRGIHAVTRLISSNANYDSWNKHYPELLIEGAVAKAKAGTGDFSLATFFEKLLQAKYGRVNQTQNKMYREQK